MRCYADDIVTILPSHMTHGCAVSAPGLWKPPNTQCIESIDILNIRHRLCSSLRSVGVQFPLLLYPLTLLSSTIPQKHRFQSRFRADCRACCI